MRTPMVAILCAGCWATPAPTSRPAAAEVPAPIAGTPAAARSARILVDDTRWIDIAIDGADARAAALCELVLDDAVTRAASTARVIRRCAPDPLPRLARERGVLLVARESLDEAHLAIPLLVRLTDLADDGAATAHGVATTYVRVSDHARCVRAADELRESIEEARQGAVDATRTFVATQLDEARREEATACDDARRLAPRCAQVSADMRSICETVVRDARRRCDDAGERVAMLEQQQRQPITVPATRTVRCVDE